MKMLAINFRKTNLQRNPSAKKYFRRSFMKNMRILIVFFLLVVTLASCFGFNALRAQKQNVQQSVEIMADVLNRELQRIYDVVRVISNSAVFKELREKRKIESPADYLVLATAGENLNKELGTFDSIQYIFFKFRKNGVIISNQGIFMNDEGFEQILQFSLEQILDRTVQQTYLSQTAFPVVFHAYSANSSMVTKDEAITFNFYVPFASENGVDAYVLIKEKFVSEMAPAICKAPGGMRIRALNGSVVYQCGNAGGGDAFLEYDSANNMFSIEAYAPFTSIIKLMAWPLAICLLYVLAGVAASFFIAFRMTKKKFVAVYPIVQRIGKTEIADDNTDEMDMIAQYIRSLESKGKNVSEELSILRSSLRRNTQMMLLNGVTELAPELLADFPKRYLVGYGYSKCEDETVAVEMPLIHMLALEQMIQNLPEKIDLHMLNNHSFAFVYPLENESVETVNKNLAELVRQINERAPCPISISLSQPTEGSDQVHAALEEARMMMLCDNVPVGLVSLQEEDVKQSVQFKNVVELYQALVRENEERVEQCIGEFWRRNRGMQWSMRELYGHLCNIIRFAAQDIGYGEIALEPYSIQLSPQELIEQLYSAAESLCHWRTERKQRYDEKQRQAVFAFIKENIGRVDFAMQDICARFQLSERGVQALIHSETGMGLPAYLLKLRLEQAAEQLVSTDLPVYVICEQAGFNTLSTFQKAFKRSYAMAPGEYRRAKRGEMDNTQADK